MSGWHRSHSIRCSDLFNQPITHIYQTRIFTNSIYISEEFSHDTQTLIIQLICYFDLPDTGHQIRANRLLSFVEINDNSSISNATINWKLKADSKSTQQTKCVIIITPDNWRSIVIFGSTLFCCLWVHCTIICLFPVRIVAVSPSEFRMIHCNAFARLWPLVIGFLFYSIIFYSKRDMDSNG